MRHGHLQLPAFPSEPDDRVSSGRSSSSSSSSSSSRSYSSSGASSTKGINGTAETTNAAVDPKVKRIPPPTLVTSAMTGTATDHPQGECSDMETDGEVLGKDAETANQASPPPAEPANRTPPRAFTGSNNAEPDAEPRSRQPGLCYDDPVTSAGTARIPQATEFATDVDVVTRQCARVPIAPRNGLDEGHTSRAWVVTFHGPEFAKLFGATAEPIPSRVDGTMAVVKRYQHRDRMIMVPSKPRHPVATDKPSARSSIQLLHRTKV